MSSVSPRAPRGKYVDRPNPCPQCGASTSWNGIRYVASIRKAPGEPVRRDTDVPRRRVRCPACDAPDWTVYEDGAYPHRSFQPEVAASAVAQFAVGSATQADAAAEHGCSRDTVRRWIRWIERLVEPAHLEQVCARLDPDGVPAAPGRPMSRAGRILEGVERLADLLVARGTLLPRHGPALARILTDRFVRFREVFYLTKLSPPLRADLLTLGV